MAGAVDLSGLKQRAQQQTPAGGPGAPAVEGGPGPIAVTEANFEQEVLVRSGDVPVVVVLWSPRSDVCVQLVETLSGLAGEDNGTWSLVTANVDAVPRVAQIFGVDAVPTVVALAAGQPLSSFQGMQPPEQLRQWLDQILAATAGKLRGPTGSAEPAEVDPELDAARQHLDAGDFEAARTSYQAILDANPDSTEAKGAIRQLDFLTRATGHGPDAVAVADATSNDIEAAFAAADVQLLSQDVSGAFERLTTLVRNTSGDERTRVRTRLIELFELFDPADPEVIVGRRNLANALY